MTARALLAIVAARLRAERRALAYAFAAAFAVGILQRPGPGAAVLFCSLLGIFLALIQTPGRRAHLDLCEQSAPLFGRELARGKALAPCIAAALATLANAIGLGLRSSPQEAALAFAAALVAATACTLVALCASLRAGGPRAMYVGLAGACALAAFVLAQNVGLAAELPFCAATAYVALRQYGEALARYDPV